MVQHSPATQPVNEYLGVKLLGDNRQLIVPAISQDVATLARETFIKYRIF